MRTKHLMSILIFIGFFLFVPTLYAQDEGTADKNKKSEKAEVQEDRANDIRAAFLEMFAKGKLVEPTGKPCNPMPIIKDIDPQKLLPSAKDINQKFSHLQSMFDKQNSSKQFEGIDKGFLATKMDKLLLDFSNVKLNKDGDPILDAQFTEAYSTFARPEIYFEIIELSSGDCTISVLPSLIPGSKGLQFPTMNWRLQAGIRIGCACTEKNKERVKSTFLVYSADIQGHYTATEQNFKNSKITNPQLNINSLVCCEKEKKEESKPQIDEGKTRGQLKAETRTNGRFFIGGQIGVPTGEESDFFGFAYGFGAVYFQKLSRKFEIGGEIGYTRFTGKETDFGFGSEGISYVPIEGQLNYNFNTTFGFNINAGYAIATSEGVDGGFTYGLGPTWTPIQNFIFFLQYQSISFREGNLNSIQLGVLLSSFWKKKK